MRAELQHLLQRWGELRAVDRRRADEVGGGEVGRQGWLLEISGLFTRSTPPL